MKADCLSSCDDLHDISLQNAEAHAQHVNSILLSKENLELVAKQPFSQTGFTDMKMSFCKIDFSSLILRPLRQSKMAAVALITEIISGRFFS